MSDDFLKERDIFFLGVTCSFYATLPSLFLCDNGSLSFEPTRGEVHIERKNQRGLDTSLFLGRWVVTKITQDGGSGRDIPSDSPNAGYPDGHHVWARKILKSFINGIEYLSVFEIDFYQSGCFTCMNPHLKSTGVWKGSLL